MPTNQKLSITFAELATAYTSRLLSEEVFLILSSLVSDGPPWLNSRTETNRPATSALRLQSKPSATHGREPMY